MRRTAFLLLTLALLTVPVCAAASGRAFDALPEEAAELAEGEGITEEGVQPSCRASSTRCARRWTARCAGRCCRADRPAHGSRGRLLRPRSARTPPALCRSSACCA